MAYLDLIAEEYYLFAYVKRLSCSFCDAHAFIPHTSRHTYPMIWCYCQMSAWQYPMFRNYTKYR